MKYTQEHTKPAAKQADPLEELIRVTSVEAAKRGYTQADVDRLCQEARERTYAKWKREGKV